MGLHFRLYELVCFINHQDAYLHSLIPRWGGAGPQNFRVYLDTRISELERVRSVFSCAAVAIDQSVWGDLAPPYTSVAQGLATQTTTECET